MLLYREAPLGPKAGAHRNGLNCLQDEAAKGKIDWIRHHFWCPFLVMRLSKTPRNLAAISFIWPAIFCFGPWVTLSSYGVSPSDLWAAGSSSRVLSFVLCAVLALALAFAALLFSPIPLSRFGSLCLLLICVVVAAVCLLFAQVVLLIWLFPLWYVFKFFRTSAA